MSLLDKPWFQFWAGHWRSDAALHLCSMGARGLWCEMLCIAHEARPRGFVLVGTVSPTAAQLAALVGAPAPDVEAWLTELEAAEVFSRDDQRRIYSRRMVKDTELSEKRSKAGAAGGRASAGARGFAKANAKASSEASSEASNEAASALLCFASKASSRDPTTATATRTPQDDARAMDKARSSRPDAEHVVPCLVCGQPWRMFKGKGRGSGGDFYGHGRMGGPTGCKATCPADEYQQRAAQKQSDNEPRPFPKE